jgi:hypothetical protein
MKRYIIEKDKHGYSLKIEEKTGHSWQTPLTLEDAFILIMSDKEKDSNLFNIQKLNDKDIKMLSRMLNQEFRKIGLIAKDMLENLYEQPNK